MALLPLRRIISGGQAGADWAGLQAAKALGLEPGGTAPKGWRICLPDGSDGSNPDLASYGLVEHPSRAYPSRTRQNVKDADGTVWFGNEDSRGGKLTIKTCKELDKPCIINPSPNQFREWLIEREIKVLNVAGNRLSPLNPDIEQRVYDFLVYAIAPLLPAEITDADMTWAESVVDRLN